MELSCSKQTLAYIIIDGPSLDQQECSKVAMTGATYQPMGTMAAPVTTYASEPLAPSEPIAEPIVEPTSRSAGGNIPPVTYTAPPIVSPVTQVAAPRQMSGPVTRVWQVRECGGKG